MILGAATDIATRSRYRKTPVIQSADMTTNRYLPTLGGTCGGRLASRAFIVPPAACTAGVGQA